MNILYGSRVNDLGDFYVLDMVTNLWIPCNFRDERIRGGCIPAAFTPRISNRPNSSGWIFSGMNYKKLDLKIILFSVVLCRRNAFR